jgi:hypothetical protein
MRETYYVRRSADDNVTTFNTTLIHNLSKFVTRMSTPDREEALYSAAESAILNPGYTYIVYKNDFKIAQFIVAKEN